MVIKFIWYVFSYLVWNEEFGIVPAAHAHRWKRSHDRDFALPVQVTRSNENNIFINSTYYIHTIVIDSKTYILVTNIRTKIFDAKTY